MIKAIGENVEAATSIFDKVISWASKGKYRAIYIVVVLQACFIISPFLYALTLMDESGDFYDQKLEVSKDLNTENGYKATLDYLDACIQSIGNENEDWYCSRAKERYKESSEKWPQGGVSEYLDNDLYEAMKIDVSHYLRSIVFSKNMRKEYQKGYVLDLVFSKGFWIFLTVASLITGFLLLAILNAGIAKKRASRKAEV